MSRKCSKSWSPSRIHPRLSSSPLQEASVIIYYKYAPPKSDSRLFFGFVFLLSQENNTLSDSKISTSSYSNTKQFILSRRILSHNNQKGWFDSSWWGCCQPLSSYYFRAKTEIIEFFCANICWPTKVPQTNWNFDQTLKRDEKLFNPFVIICVCSKCHGDLSDILTWWCCWCVAWETNICSAFVLPPPPR